QYQAAVFRRVPVKAKARMISVNSAELSEEKVNTTVRARQSSARFLQSFFKSPPLGPCDQTHPISPLPLELIDLILDHLYDDRASLVACSTVSKLWLSGSQHHLFHTIHLISRSPDHSLEAAYVFFSRSPQLCPHVRTLHIRAAVDMTQEVVKLESTPIPTGRPFVPREGVELYRLVRFLRMLGNVHTLILRGLYPVYDTSTFPFHISEFTAPSLRRLFIREIMLRTNATPFLLNLGGIFSGLDELHLLRVPFRPNVCKSGFTALNISKLTLSATSEYLVSCLHSGLRNVRVLDIEADGLYHYTRRGFLPEGSLAQLEELTIRITDRFSVQGVMALASTQDPVHPGDFTRLANDAVLGLRPCLRLHTLRILDMNPEETSLALLCGYFQEDIETLLHHAPPGIRTLAIGFTERREAIMPDVLEEWSWAVIGETISTKFSLFEKLFVGYVQGPVRRTNPDPPIVAAGVGPLPEEWRGLVRANLPSSLLDALVFE
ncbi:hypothetical protein EIP91_006817, partial [Steccherinum ochraceum]